jgi:hypothetical protein
MSCNLIPHSRVVWFVGGGCLRGDCNNYRDNKHCESFESHFWHLISAVGRLLENIPSRFQKWRGS